MSELTKLACNIAFREELNILPEDYVTKLQDIFASLPENFIRRSASSTMKYHPPYERSQPWGLLLHTMSVVRFAREFLRCRPDLENLENDIITACIIHDFCKYALNNDMAEHTSREHDHLGKMLAQVAGFNENIQTLVELHAGIWNSQGYDDIGDPTTNECSLYHLILPGCAENIKDAIWVVHYSDIVASRPYVEIHYDDVILELNQIVLPGLGMDTSGIQGYSR